MIARAFWVAFFIGALTAPIGAYAATAYTSWALIVQAVDNTCGYTRNHVDNSAKAAFQSTRNVRPSSANGACAGADEALASVPAGHLGVKVSLMNDTTSYVCGSAGPVYTSNSSATINIAVQKITSPNCPGAAGHAYFALGTGYKWRPADSAYHAQSRWSPNLNFN